MPDLPRTLVPIKPTGGRPPLYCVHPSSGSPYSYAGLVRSLHPEQPVYAFEAPGFDDDRPPATSLEALSSEYAAALREFRPEGPYCLLGWSMGGVVAFDMALRLTASGADVAALVVVDAPAPERAELPCEKDMLRKFLHDLMAAAGLPETRLPGLFAPLADDADPGSAFRRIEQAGIMPEEIDADFLGDRYTIFRAHVAALFGYAATGRYDGPVTLIRAAESPARYMDWGTVASDVDAHVVPGDHHSIWTGERLTVLTGIVQRRLDDATRMRVHRLAAAGGERRGDANGRRGRAEGG